MSCLPISRSYPPPRTLLVSSWSPVTPPRPAAHLSRPPVLLPRPAAVPSYYLTRPPAGRAAPVADHLAPPRPARPPAARPTLAAGHSPAPPLICPAHRSYRPGLRPYRPAVWIRRRPVVPPLPPTVPHHFVSPRPPLVRHTNSVCHGCGCFRNRPRAMARAAASARRRGRPTRKPMVAGWSAIA